MTKTIKITILFATSLIVLFTVWFLFHSNRLSIYPVGELPNSIIFAYGDIADGGASTANWAQNDSSLALSLIVRSGIAYPYAGMGIDLISDTKKMSGEFIDFSLFDSLSITLRTRHMKQVQVKLITNDPKLTRVEDPMTARYLLQVIPSERSYQEVRVPVSGFLVPEWWFERNGFTAPDQLKYLERGIKIDISSGSGTMLGIPDEIEIKSIHFFGENHFVNRIVFTMGLIFTVLFLGFLWIDRSRTFAVKKIEIKQIGRAHV